MCSRDNRGFPRVEKARIGFIEIIHISWTILFIFSEEKLGHTRQCSIYSLFSAQKSLFKVLVIIIIL